ncbi:cell wall vacuolar inhibitor of fructosidase 2-like [Olea europaea subsp. europaea]|uniref:Cell wall vacuolar inhibitor of fructosidase 2-like n=1 Tax=Olea europaea subsp. europaea TaxID=158383 RepID=A0A8S0SPS4_OLEEU|nr:cell wall vacuolar inhibitor of fructosidase 2-like [Olea europaea subsp. europaea]
MAISGSLPFFIFIFTFFICFSTSSFTSSSPDLNSSQLATQICENTPNVSFCLATIFSNPLASAADRYVLSYIVFGQAYKNATSTNNYIGLSLKAMKSDGNPRVLSGMQKCQGFYEDAIRALSEVMNNLDSETFYGLDKAAIDVESSIRACEASFSGQSPLSQKNQNLVELLKICFAVSQLYQYN